MPGALTDSHSLGAALDRLAADAWPALETELDDGWRLRFNEGLHRRVNSVFPEQDGATPLEARLARAEAFYRKHGLPPRFQVSAASQPEGLDGYLQNRGYQIESGVDIMTMEAENLASGTVSDVEVVLDPALSDAWLDVHMAEARDAETKALKGRMLERIRPSHVFARSVVDGKTLAAGLGIYDDGWCGIFGMFTLASARRQGHGRAILSALADWTLAQGGQSAYLQVERDNPGGLAFYRRLGFETVHGYHYRTLWGTDQ